jgi:hypothetical protein
VWENAVGDDRYGDALEALCDKKSCRQDDAEYVLRKNIEYWEKQTGSEYRANWNRALLEFIKLFPGDDYFIASDSESPDRYFYEEQEGYEQYLFPEDIPEPPTCSCPEESCALHPSEAWLRQQREAIESLQKALEVGGYAAAPGHLIGGAPLVVEDLDLSGMGLYTDAQKDKLLAGGAEDDFFDASMHMGKWGAGYWQRRGDEGKKWHLFDDTEIKLHKDLRKKGEK